MSNDSAQAPTRIYGFTGRKRHFVWQQPSPEQPVTSDERPEPGSRAELLDNVRQLAASGSGVAQGMLQVLESNAGVAALATSDVAEAESQPPQTRPEKPRRRRRKKASASDSESPLERHARRCAICGTRNQEEIEDAFVNWESVDTIARSYGVERHSIYRHAHATGLFAQRDHNIRRGLGLLIHRADKVYDVTADHVIRAAKTLAQINEHGQWTTPPTHVIVSSGAARPADAGAPERPS